MKLWEGLDSRYRFENTDVNIDGSAVVINGPEAGLGAVGYPRDFRDQSRKQVEFLTAELQKSKIPFFMRAYKGNTSDPEQYRDALPDIFSMIREGSWIIVDNGGASGDMLDFIVKASHRYLTRVKMNTSDDKRIADPNCEWEYVEDGVCCKEHTHSIHRVGQHTFSSLLILVLFLSFRFEKLRPHGRGCEEDDDGARGTFRACDEPSVDS